MGPHRAVTTRVSARGKWRSQAPPPQMFKNLEKFLGAPRHLGKNPTYPPPFVTAFGTQRARVPPPQPSLSRHTSQQQPSQRAQPRGCTSPAIGLIQQSGQKWMSKCNHRIRYDFFPKMLYWHAQVYILPVRTQRAIVAAEDRYRDRRWVADDWVIWTEDEKLEDCI